MEALKKISMKTAVVMGICFYSLAILTHVLVIGGIIPFTWINGGRSESLSVQIPISVISIIILIAGGLFTLIAGGLFTLIAGRNIHLKYKRSITVISWFFVILWSIGFAQQLLGTYFEKFIISLIMILGIISNLRMAIEKRN